MENETWFAILWKTRKTFPWDLVDGPYVHAAYFDYKAAIIDFQNIEPKFPQLDFEFVAAQEESQKLWIKSLGDFNLENILRHQEMERDHQRYLAEIWWLEKETKGLGDSMKWK